ncbi:MAG TPA: phosphoribosyl-ATP diphosphatase, partial [Candidatus Spyradocola merdavium]|nr:phosphoribosyl-ATP diphosphatase [Candidatus Spyradocola merdavium]
KLLEKGVDKIGKKVVEEAAEVLIAAKNRSVEEVRFEVADLMYHLTVLLADQGMSWDDIYAELENRHR